MVLGQPEERRINRITDLSCLVVTSTISKSYRFNKIYLKSSSQVLGECTSQTTIYVGQINLLYINSSILHSPTLSTCQPSQNCRSVAAWPQFSQGHSNPGALHMAKVICSLKKISGVGDQCGCLEMTYLGGIKIIRFIRLLKYNNHTVILR